MDHVRMPDRRTAKKVAYAAQAAVAGVLVLTTAVVALGVPGLEPSRVEPPTPQPIAPQERSEQTAATAPRIDAQAVSYMLGSVKNRPEPPAVVQAGHQEPTESAPPPTSGGVRFLGGIIEPGRAVALLSIDGVQRMVPVGREFRGYRVLRVEADHVVLSAGADDIVIDKADRQGSVVSAVTPRARTAGPGPGAAAVMSQPGAEDPAALRARAAERAREEFARRRGDFERHRTDRAEQPEEQR
ncbi:MAG: hypothetical protein KIS87_07615 [Phycisphaeraceae bacterium]|nr:hypothetical protein [Phycisphaeraceae bacterium]